MGDTHFVGLFNIVYNGQKADGSNGGYAEALTQEQLDWLRNDLQHVEREKNIVVAAHAPIVDYRGVTTDNASALYEILADYPNAVTVGGHTHTLEHLLAGDSRQEWIDAGIPELTHDQLVAGAVSGSWYSGELNENGVPYSYTSDAAEPGVLTLELAGTELTEEQAQDIVAFLGTLTGEQPQIVHPTLPVRAVETPHPEPIDLPAQTGAVAPQGADAAR